MKDDTTGGSPQLDLKLLDRSLESHAAARQAFSRDLKIVVAAILVFQFGIFFRYVDMSDDAYRLDAQAKEVSEASAALKSVQDGLESLVGILKSGREAVAEDLKKAPPELRAEIVAINKAIADAGRPAPFAGNIAPDNPAAQVAPVAGQRAVSRPDFFDDLTQDQKTILLKGQDREKLAGIAKQVLHSKILPAFFGDLNARKAEVVEKPFDAQADRIIEVLRTQETLIQRVFREEAGEPKGRLAGASKWDPEAITEAILDAKAKVDTLKFEPPRGDDWLRTVSEKEAQFKVIEADIVKAMKQVEDELAGAKQSAQVAGGRLDQLAKSTGERKATLDAGLKELNDQSNKVNSSLTDLVKPLAAVSLRARDLVCYDPVLLSAVFGFFLWRGVTLRRRARILAAACREAGYSDRAVAAYFDEAPPAEPREQIPPFLARGTATLGLVGPLILAGTCTWRLLSSPSLTAEVPRLLNCASVVLLAAVIAVEIARPGRLASLRQPG